MEVQKFAEQKIIKYINVPLKEHYCFDWFYNKDAAGVCANKRKIIFLSKPIISLNLDKIEFIIDVLFHEIAHALDWELNRNFNHGKTWKEIANVLGCKPQNWFNPDLVNMPQKKYLYICPNCGAEFSSDRRVIKYLGACKSCCDKYNNRVYTSKFNFILKLCNY
jgi:predicted SprT family Zn-dependent metalloprotease